MLAQRVPTKYNTLDVNTLRHIFSQTLNKKFTAQKVPIKKDLERGPRTNTFRPNTSLNKNRGIKSSYKTSLSRYLLFASLSQ